MPEYEWTGDTSEIPSLGLTLERGQRVTLDKPFNHPDLKPVSKGEKTAPAKGEK